MSQQPIPVDMEALQERSRRALEVLNGAGWAFDEYIADETKALLATRPEQTLARELSYHLIRAAAEVKARLIVISQKHAQEVALADRRNQV